MRDAGVRDRDVGARGGASGGGPPWPRRGAALGRGGCALLVLVGLTAALGGAQSGARARRLAGVRAALRCAPNGLAGIFLALAGVTGAAVSLAYAELPAGRWLTGLSSVLLLAVAVTIGSDNAFLFFLAWELLTVCIYLIASADREHPGELLAGYLTGGLAKIGGARYSLRSRCSTPTPTASRSRRGRTRRSRPGRAGCCSRCF